MESSLHADIAIHEAIMDSGCSKGAVSSERFENFRALLAAEFPHLVASACPSATRCRFAGGEPKAAESTACVPVPSIAWQTDFEVVNTGSGPQATPFLSSKISATTVCAAKPRGNINVENSHQISD
eukprot:5695744-Pyramimonas_sp.AAC.1